MFSEQIFLQSGLTSSEYRTSTAVDYDCTLVPGGSAAAGSDSSSRTVLL